MQLAVVLLNRKEKGKTTKGKATYYYGFSVWSLRVRKHSIRKTVISNERQRIDSFVHERSVGEINIQKKGNSSEYFDIYNSYCNPI